MKSKKYFWVAIKKRNKMNSFLKIKFAQKIKIKLKRKKYLLKTISIKRKNDSFV